MSIFKNHKFVTNKSFSLGFVVLLVCIFKCGLAYGQSTLSSLYESCSNYISITGETNINEFRLDQNVPEHLICGLTDNTWIQLPDQHVYMITIPVRNFNASNKMVYRDFLKLLDVSTHPYIKIFLDENQFKTLFHGQSVYAPEIGVMVGGTTRYYKIPCSISNCLDGRILIAGSKELRLTDFKLAPPEKSFGLIKVQDKLIINFEFSLPSDPELKLTQI